MLIVLDIFSFVFECKCFFGRLLSVFRHEGVVEGGTGEIARERAEQQNNKEEKTFR